MRPEVLDASRAARPGATDNRTSTAGFSKWSQSWKCEDAQEGVVRPEHLPHDVKGVHMFPKDVIDLPRDVILQELVREPLVGVLKNSIVQVVALQGGQYLSDRSASFRKPFRVERRHVPILCVERSDREAVR